jgi:CBS domain-containing protein
MIVRDIMYPRVARILSSQNLGELLQQLVRESVSGVPVVEPDCRLVGVVSMRDLMKAIADGMAADPEQTIARLLSTEVRDIMTPMPFTVAPDMPVTELAGALKRRGIHRAFVVKEGRLRGVVSTSDLLRAAADTDGE